MRRSRLPACSIVTSIVVALGVAAPAQADLFLEIDGVRGESQDSRQTDSIDVLAFTWGATHKDKKALTKLEDISVTKRVDIASPPLFQRLAQGTTIPSMELLVRKGGEAPQIYLRYCFQSVQVASISHSGASGEPIPTENVSFSYGAVSEQYSQQDPRGGLGDTLFAGWNATTGQLIAAYPTPCGGV